eukprot:2430134-Prymnesium_polylepis.1
MSRETTPDQAKANPLEQFCIAANSVYIIRLCDNAELLQEPLHNRCCQVSITCVDKLVQCHIKLDVYQGSGLRDSRFCVKNLRPNNHICCMDATPVAKLGLQNYTVNQKAVRQVRDVVVVGGVVSVRIVRVVVEIVVVSVKITRVVVKIVVVTVSAKLTR